MEVVYLPRQEPRLLPRNICINFHCQGESAIDGVYDADVALRVLASIPIVHFLGPDHFYNILATS